MKYPQMLFVPLLLLFASCSTLTKNQHGFQAVVSVETRGSDANELRLAKAELISYIEKLGFVKDVDLYRRVMSDEKFIRFDHPKDNTVFYNLYIDSPGRIDITIRDNRRTYTSSEELRQEIEGLLNLLKKYFGERNVKFEQQSTFLS